MKVHLKVFGVTDVRERIFVEDGVGVLEETACLTDHTLQRVGGDSSYGDMQYSNLMLHSCIGHNNLNNSLDTTNQIKSVRTVTKTHEEFGMYMHSRLTHTHTHTHTHQQ